MRPARSALLLLALAFAAPARGEAPPFALKDGDRVVFYGDSITDQRLYTTFTETFVVTRFPDRKISFVHSGWGGDRVGGGGGGKIDKRLARDVVAYKPTVMSIMLGMNDASYREFDPRIFATYESGYKHILDVLKKDLPDLRLTLIVPSPFDDVAQPPKFEGGYNAVLLQYGDFVRKLARDNGATVADLNTSVVEATKKAVATDAELAKKLNPDRVHPAKSGQLLMAAALLRAWNAPAIVSEVTIGGAGASDVKAQNAKVTDFQSKDGGFAWTELDAALPFPIDLADPATRLAVASSTLVDDLNRQVVRVKLDDAKTGDYTLKIDGKEVGTFSAGKLRDGINLATLSTPMLEQARQVHSLTLKHNNQHFFRWRTVQVPLENESASDLAKVLEGLDAIESKTVEKQRETAKPKAHKFELTPKK